MAYIGKIPAAAPLTSSDVADGIITNAKLAQDIISADTALASEPADTDEFLVSDAGVLKRMDYSYIKASPAMVLLATNTITSGTPATTSFDGYFSSTYKNYVVYFNHLIPATNAVQPWIRVRQSDSDVTTAGAYGFANTGIYREDGSGDGVFSGGGNDSAGELCYNRNGSNVAVDGGFSGILEIFDPLNATTHKLISGKLNFVGDNQTIFQTTDTIVRFEGNTTALSGITLYFSSGNITTGVLKLYGIK